MRRLSNTQIKDNNAQDQKKMKKLQILVGKLFENFQHGKKDIRTVIFLMFYGCSTVIREDFILRLKI